MNLFNFPVSPDEQEEASPPAASSLVDTRSTPEAVASLLTPPKSPLEQARENHGGAGFMLKAILGGMTGTGAMLLPEFSRSNKAQYKADLELYNTYREMSLVDPQVEAYAKMFDEKDPLKAAAIRAGNVSEFNPNDFTLGTNQTRFNPLGDAVAEGHSDPYAGLPAPVAQTLFIQENPHLREEVMTNAKILKDPDNARDVAEAQGRGSGDAERYTTESNKYINAVENDLVLEQRLGIIDEGLAMFDESNPDGPIDTGFAQGILFNVFGIGDEQQGYLASLSVEEAMNALAEFKGVTTDFEFTKSELRAFAQIAKGEDINRGTLKAARGAIERERRRNAQTAVSSFDTAYDLDADAMKKLGINYQLSPYMRSIYQEQSKSESVNENQNAGGSTGAPKVGEVVDGFRFKGGNPNSPDSWEPLK